MRSLLRMLHTENRALWTGEKPYADLCAIGARLTNSLQFHLYIWSLLVFPSDLARVLIYYKVSTEEGDEIGIGKDLIDLICYDS
jgi:hypothetical protein